MAGRQVEDCGGIWGHRGWQCSWHNMLLTAYILSSCLLKSQAYRKILTLVADPPKPIIGDNVAIIPQGAMNNSVACRWYRRGMAMSNLILNFYNHPINMGIEGSQYTGREKIQPKSCQLLLTNLNPYDATTYFVILDRPPVSESGKIKLNLTIDATRITGAETETLSKGVIAGIVIGGLVVAVAMVGGIYIRSRYTSY